jgi:hypothetical protein
MYLFDFLSTQGYPYVGTNERILRQEDLEDHGFQKYLARFELRTQKSLHCLRNSISGALHQKSHTFIPLNTNTDYRFEGRSINYPTRRNP